MAIRVAKRKYKKVRKEFKYEIKKELKKNRALGMAILSTYIANKHRTHIYKMWHLLETQYWDAYKGYCESELHEKMIFGDESIYDTLYFSGYEDIANKYICKLPEEIAFGEIHGIIIKCLNGGLKD